MAINPADITTVRVGQLAVELPTLTSIIAHEIGEELYRCTIQELVQLLNLNVGTLQYEVKTLYVDQEYIDTNFDSTGLGRLLCAGFARVNGNNGTPPSDGMFELSYKAGVYEIGSYGGEKEHTLTIEEMPIHDHGIDVNESDSGNNNRKIQGGNLENPVEKKTKESGGGQAHNNMPPYFVCLKIMKL